MSVKLMAEVLEASPYEGTALLVHLILANHANDDGVCWPSVLTIARQARVQDRQVQKIMATMESEGYIERSERPGRSNLIQVRGVLQDRGRGVPQDTGGDESQDTRGVSPRTPRTIKEPSVEPGGASRPRDEIFDVLCEVCRLDPADLTKDARGRVNAAVKQLRDIEAEPTVIRDRARRYGSVYPNVPLTPQALTANWGQLAPATAVHERSVPEFHAEAPASDEDRALALAQIQLLAQELRHD